METSSADHAAPGLRVIGVAQAELVLARPSTELLRQTGVQPAIVTPLIEIRLLLVSSIGRRCTAWETGRRGRATRTGRAAASTARRARVS